MGWIQDGAYDHEGWVANVLDDGRTASGTTGGGVLLLEVTAVDRAAGYQISSHPNGAESVVIPWERVATWQARCECGWRGSSRRAATNEEHGDRDCPGEIEDSFIREWQTHVAPYVALTDLGHLIDQQRALDNDIEGKVRLARHHGASWSDVGRAAGMTKQGAQQRWGGPTAQD